MPIFISIILTLISFSVFANPLPLSCDQFKSQFKSENIFSKTLDVASQKIFSEGGVNCDPDNYGDAIYMGCDRINGNLLYASWECYRRDDNAYIYFTVDTKTLVIKIIGHN